jgi:hypothetical protein
LNTVLKKALRTTAKNASLALILVQNFGCFSLFMYSSKTLGSIMKKWRTDTYQIHREVLFSMSAKKENSKSSKDANG